MNKPTNSTFKRDDDGKIIRDREFFQTIGKIGGNRTKASHKDDPLYYSRIGDKGGAKMKKRGFAFYSRIGKMSKRPKRQRLDD